MNAFCKYHPNDAASWNCSHCQVHFCQNCVPTGQASIVPQCTLCRHSLTSLSVAKNIPPFWTQLSFFFLLPFKPPVLIILCIYAVITSLIPSGKLGLAIFVLLLFPVSDFLFSIMEKIANGEPVKKEKKSWFSTDKKAFFTKLLLTYGLMIIFISKIMIMFGESVGYVIATFFILGLPASIIILMMEKQMLSMLNPMKIIVIVKLMGSAYFLLYGLAMIVMSISFYFSSIFDEQSRFIAEFLANSFSFYLIIILFSMMGYLIFQYHHELNYRIKSENLYTLKEKINEAMVEVDIFLQEGRFEDAQKILLEQINHNPLNYKANEKLITLYGFQGNDAHLNKVANTYFENLVETGKSAQAASFYSALSQKEIAFFLNNVTTAISIASAMNNSQQFNIALSLLEYYSDKPSENEFWDDVAFLKAKLYAEFTHDNQKAIDLLNLIIKRSIKQTVLNDAECFLKIIS